MHRAFNFVASFFDEVGDIRGYPYRVGYLMNLEPPQFIEPQFNGNLRPIRVDRFSPFV